MKSGGFAPSVIPYGEERHSRVRDPPNFNVTSRDSLKMYIYMYVCTAVAGMNLVTDPCAARLF